MKSEDQGHLAAPCGSHGPVRKPLEGLAEWHRLYAELCRCDGKPPNAEAHEQWASEIDGAQAAIQRGTV